jgi:hypothetical protein
MARRSLSAVNGHWGFGIEDFGFGGNDRSNIQSSIPNPRACTRADRHHNARHALRLWNPRVIAIVLLALWQMVVMGLVTISVWSNPVHRAVLGMGWGLQILWVGVCGTGMVVWRDRLNRLVSRVSIPWGLKFVLGCTVLALIEEAITTSLTNSAPWFGVAVGEAYITASANYLDVVLYHSVVVFVPMFIAWAVLLRWWRFSPFAVFLLFGITGTLAETLTFGPQNLANFAFWIFVYGLMVWLPGQWRKWRIGEDHGQVACVGGGDDFGVAHRTAGLDGGGGAGLGGGDQSVREREESVAANHAALEGKPGFARFPDGDAAGVDPAHLAGADAEGLPRVGVDDGVGFDVFDDPPAEQHGLEFLGRWVVVG